MLSPTTLMEQELDHAMFWLPSEFLDEVNSGLTSPVESATESDEEEYLNQLSRNLAQSTLDDNFDTPFSKSPQSTLCGYNHMSSRGSSNCPSPAPAPVTSHVEPSWEVLCAAAGEVARLKMTEEAGYSYRRVQNPNPHFHHVQAAQLKQHQFMKQQQILQQQQHQYQQFVQQQNRAGGNMRAVFLGNINTKRESTGTGVFLPRQIGAPIEPRSKRGCSTVLLPDRVVHALNLNLEGQNRSNVGLANHDYDAGMRYRNSVVMAEQWRRQAEKELRLPQEWTY